MPGNEPEIQALVREAASQGRVLRVVGTGHSFTPLVESDGLVVSLDRFAGIDSIDAASQEARIRGGTKLHALGAPLREAGLAMRNLGDIDVQSLAGALSTGTHGTGPSLANLPSQLRALRLICGSGEELECSGEIEPDLFHAARVSLGALGVITTVTLGLVPAYRLHERIWRTDLDTVMAQLDEHVTANRHFEFFWFPRHDFAELKALNPSSAAPSTLPDREGERIGWSADVLPSARDLKFNEMEYAVPAADGPACMKALAERIRARHPEVSWPVEYRTLAADDAWLSPAHGRDTVTISVHQDGRHPFRAFFSDVEDIFREFAGRPHWGKIHTRSAAELQSLYEHWDDFHAVRRRVDPGGVFLNRYLRELFDA